MIESNSLSLLPDSSVDFPLDLIPLIQQYDYTLMCVFYPRLPLRMEWLTVPFIRHCIETHQVDVLMEAFRMKQFPDPDAIEFMDTLVQARFPHACVYHRLMSEITHVNQYVERWILRAFDTCFQESIYIILDHPMMAWVWSDDMEWALYMKDRTLIEYLIEPRSIPVYS
jgi:hypothetical protein